MPITLAQPISVLTIDMTPGTMTELLVSGSGFPVANPLTVTVEDLHRDESKRVHFGMAHAEVVDERTLRVWLTCEPRGKRLPPRSGSIRISVSGEDKMAPAVLGPLHVAYSYSGYGIITFSQEPEYQVIDLKPGATSYLYYNYAGPDYAFRTYPAVETFHAPDAYPDGWSWNQTPGDFQVETMGAKCVRISLKRAPETMKKSKRGGYAGTGPTTSNVNFTLWDNSHTEQYTSLPVKVVYINIP